MLTTDHGAVATEQPLRSMEVLVAPALLAQRDASCAADPAAIATAVAESLGAVYRFLARYEMRPAGPPRVTYRTWEAQRVELTAAVPITEVPPNAIEIDDVSIEAVPESQALRFEHRGPYSALRDTYARIEAWLRERGGIHTARDWSRYAPMWEEYMNDPATTPESELITRIYLTLP